jgi:MraZ protein
VFQGSASLSLDAKGRLSVPSRHRDALQAQCAGQLTLTRHPDGCLLVYPRPVWEQKRAEIMAFPASARALQRLLLGHAMDVELDGTGRVLIAPELRTAAHIERDVLLMGMGAHFELWDRATHDAVEAKALSAGVTDALAGSGFSF